MQTIEEEKSRVGVRARKSGRAIHQTLHAYNRSRRVITKQRTLQSTMLIHVTWTRCYAAILLSLVQTKTLHV